MTSDVNPTVRRRELAKYFRDLRHQHGYQLDQVANALDASMAKASRLESGARGISLDDVRKLSAFYRLPSSEHERILAIAAESRQRGWWQQVDLPGPLRTFIGIEQAALGINEYNTSLVPGLLQTAEYAAAVSEGDLDATPEAKHAGVEVRLARQQVILRDAPPAVWVVIDEAALARVIGGPEVMGSQLARLREMSAQPFLTIQVIPFEYGSHPGLNSDFVLLEISDDRLSDVVYVEGLIGSFFRDAPDDVRRYRRVWAQLRALALSPLDTLSLLGEYEARQLP